MRYCKIGDINIQHIKNLIVWLFEECISAGGDGDAFWYSEYFDIKDIIPLVEEFNSSLKHPFTIKVDDNSISWFDGQEGILITNSEEVYKNFPSYAQVVIKY